MTYKGSYKLSKENHKRYNGLLQLDLEEYLPYYNCGDIEKLDAKTDDYIGIADVSFDNGYYVTIDIASGTSNYYDSIVLYDNLDRELYVFDCDYTIGSFEFVYNNDKYIVEVELI